MLYIISTSEWENTFLAFPPFRLRPSDSIWRPRSCGSWCYVLSKSWISTVHGIPEKIDRLQGNLQYSVKETNERAPSERPVTLYIFSFLLSLWLLTWKLRVVSDPQVLELCSIASYTFRSPFSWSCEALGMKYRSLARYVYKIRQSRQEWSQPRRPLKYQLQALVGFMRPFVKCSE